MTLLLGGHGLGRDASHLEFFGDEEGELERLLRIQPRIAESLIPATEIGLRQAMGAADAFGDVLARHLDMRAARPGAFRRMRFEEAAHLAQDGVEAAGLSAMAGGDGVAVHRVADPADRRAFLT